MNAQVSTRQRVNQQAKVIVQTCCRQILLQLKGCRVRSLGHVSHDFSVLPVRAGLQEGVRSQQQVKAARGLQQPEVEQHVLAPACRKLAEGLVHAIACHAGGLAAPVRVISVYLRAVIADSLCSLAGMARLHMQKLDGDGAVSVKGVKGIAKNIQADQGRPACPIAK